MDRYLPIGWEWTTIGELAERVTKGSTPTSYGFKYQQEGINFVKTENITEDGTILDITDYIDETTNRFLNRSILQSFDLLFSIAGTIGRVGIVQEKDLPANTNQALAILRGIHRKANHKYVYYFLKSPYIQKQAQNLVVGVGRANLSLANVSSFEIPLPPLPEQERIVRRIESLFTRLDAGVAGLKRAQAALKRYRASVLKAACEGKLVPQDAEDEPAETNIKRLQSTRRKKPHALDIADLPELPKGWSWANFEQIAANEANALKAGPFGSSLKKEIYTLSGYKIYGQEQVIRNDPFFGEYYINENKYQELYTCAVKPGDILISLVGTIGKVLILPDNAEPGIINPRLVKLSPDKETVLPRYIQYYLESTNVRVFWSLSSHGETMDVLNLKTIKSLPVPLPPLAEQQRIVDEIERRLSVVQEVEAAVQANLRRAGRLRQAILRRAFEGRLV